MVTFVAPIVNHIPIVWNKCVIQVRTIDALQDVSQLSHLFILMEMAAKFKIDLYISKINNIRLAFDMGGHHTCRRLAGAYMNVFGTLVKRFLILLPVPQFQKRVMNDTETCIFFSISMETRKMDLNDSK